MPLPLIALTRVGQAVDLVSSLWQNRAELGDAGSKVMTLVETALTRGAEGLIAVRGGEVVYAGATSVQTLAFLQRADVKLDALTQTSAHIDTGIGMLASGLDSVRLLAVAGIGVSTVSSVLLSAQLHRLKGDVAALSAVVHDIRDMVEAGTEAELLTGVQQLGFGSGHADRNENERAEQSFHAALQNCLKGVNYYRGLLHRELGKRTPRIPVVLTLARHLTVALTATSGCHIGLGRDDRATGEIDTKIEDLRAAARHVFQRTIASNPERFLAPGLAAHDVTLETLAEVYRQAAFAGIIDGSCLQTAAGLFENLRAGVSRVRNPRLRKTGKFLAWKRELLDAAAAVEDVNRVIALGSLIRSIGVEDGQTANVLRQIRTELATKTGKSGAMFLFVPH